MLKFLPLRNTLLLLGLCAPLAAETLGPGSPAPDFRLRDADGAERALADFRGKWLVLYFYPKDDTPGCTAEACAFRDELEIIHQLDARVVGVSVDDAESHRAFIAKYGLPFPLLSDPDGAVAERYGARGGLFGFVLARRHTFLIDPDGVIQRVWREVRPKDHAKEVIAALRGLR